MVSWITIGASFAALTPHYNTTKTPQKFPYPIEAKQHPLCSGNTEFEGAKQYRILPIPYFRASKENSFIQTEGPILTTNIYIMIDT